jgi:hypothetical protein
MDTITLKPITPVCDVINRLKTTGWEVTIFDTGFVNVEFVLAIKVNQYFDLWHLRGLFDEAGLYAGRCNYDPRAGLVYFPDLTVDGKAYELIICK